MNWKGKFSNFMYGRYGVDQLSKFMLTVTLIFCVLSIFVPAQIRSFVNTLVLLLIILTYFRMFSRNIYKRAAENEKYLKITRSWRKKYNTEKNIAKQKKYYKFFRCPRCKQRIRIPKGHGRIEIKCPKCNERFIRKS